MLMNALNYGAIPSADARRGSDGAFSVFSGFACTDMGNASRQVLCRDFRGNTMNFQLFVDMDNDVSVPANCVFHFKQQRNSA